MSLDYDKLRKVLEAMPMKFADDNLKKNASAAENVGLEVRVTREYDGVGLSGGRQCQWCLDRCGENMTLQEAYAKGAFQRHDGCNCIIEYTSNKGVKTIQTGKYSGWNFGDELEKRKSIGLDEKFFSDELLSRVNPYIDAEADTMYVNAKNGGDYKDTIAHADTMPKAQLEKTIRRHIQRVEEHEWKINNPEENSERYRTGDEKEKRRVIHDWENHRRKSAREAMIEIKLWEEKYR